MESYSLGCQGDQRLSEVRVQPFDLVVSNSVPGQEIISKSVPW